MKRSYCIKDVEKLTGIKAHTIRIWEQRYHIVEPKRTETNIRIYSDEDLKKLLNISLLYHSGHKISNLARMNPKQLCDLIVKEKSRERATDIFGRELLSATLDFDEKKFEETLSDVIFQHGFEQAIVKVIYPFFEQLGILWQAGSINLVQEHFISNLIRQKIIAATDLLHRELKPNARTFTLFLHSSEMHEIGLLFLNYIIRKAGHRTVYLGQLVPSDDLRTITRKYKNDILVTSIITQVSQEYITNLIQGLSEGFPNQTLVLTGEQVKNYDLHLPQNVFYSTNISMFNDFLNEINKDA